MRKLILVAASTALLGFASVPPAIAMPAHGLKVRAVSNSEANDRQWPFGATNLCSAAVVGRRITTKTTLERHGLAALLCV
jgi:hypothetical protein